jgi:lipopolysaccharide biosynthesis glycosyltransferase
VSTDCSICYVSSMDYLLPSIVSASRIRKYIPDHKADVFIFLTSREEGFINEINRFLSPLHIEVRGFDGSSISELESQQFEGYITSTTLGRFFIGELVPATCRRIVYIDGDTWIKQGPEILVDAEVPEGRFAAAEDIISFRRNDYTPAGRRISTYFNGLAINRTYGYFNSGVFAVSKKTWMSLAAEAFEFFKKNREVCNCLDQSALNAIMGDRRLRLSLKWNFQSPARFMGIEKRVNPAVYHFNQYIKPWMGVCKPWEDMYPTYSAALVPFEALGLPLPMVSAAETDAHNKRMNIAKNAALKSPLFASLTSLHMGVGAYERDAWI